MAQGPSSFISTPLEHMVQGSKAAVRQASADLRKLRQEMQAMAREGKLIDDSMHQREAQLLRIKQAGVDKSLGPTTVHEVRHEMHQIKGILESGVTKNLLSGKLDFANLMSMGLSRNFRNIVEQGILGIGGGGGGPLGKYFEEISLAQSDKRINKYSIRTAVEAGKISQRIALRIEKALDRNSGFGLSITQRILSHITPPAGGIEAAFESLPIAIMGIQAATALGEAEYESISGEAEANRRHARIGKNLASSEVSRKIKELARKEIEHRSWETKDRYEREKEEYTQGWKGAINLLNPITFAPTFDKMIYDRFAEHYADIRENKIATLEEQRERTISVALTRAADLGASETEIYAYAKKHGITSEQLSEQRKKEIKEEILQQSNKGAMIYGRPYREYERSITSQWYNPFGFHGHRAWGQGVDEKEYNRLMAQMNESALEKLVERMKKRDEAMELKMNKRSPSEVYRDVEEKRQWSIIDAAKDKRFNASAAYKSMIQVIDD